MKRRCRIPEGDPDGYWATGCLFFFRLDLDLRSICLVLSILQSCSVIQAYILKASLIQVSKLEIIILYKSCKLEASVIYMCI